MSKLYFSPPIFEAYPEVKAFHTLRDESQPGGFSMKKSNVSTEEALANAETLGRELGVTAEKIGIINVQHGSDIVDLSNYDPHNWPKADAATSNLPGLFVAVTVADCLGILLYDPKNKAVAAVHSGWRGTVLNVVGKTVAHLKDKYGSRPDELIAYIGPSPIPEEYEVGPDVYEQFDAKYSTPKSDEKKYFDNKLAVYDQLLEAGLTPEKIEADHRSNIADQNFHSHRRDQQTGGRMAVGIGLKA